MWIPLLIIKTHKNPIITKIELEKSGDSWVREERQLERDEKESFLIEKR